MKYMGGFRKYVKPANRRRDTTQPHSVRIIDKDAYPGRFGLGWIINPKDDGRTLEGHTGGAPGGTAFMMMSTTENIGVIFFINYYREFYHPLEGFAWSKLKQMLFEKASDL